MSEKEEFHCGITKLPPLASLAMYFPSCLDPYDLGIEVVWHVYLCHEPVQPSLFTKHKTTKRLIYDPARSKLPNPVASEPMPEVLLQNHNGEVMEGSITTPYFWRNACWITPPAECGGNQGTTRRWALDSHLVIEGVVKMSEVVIGETILLSNGVRGFGFGKIVPRIAGCT